MIGYSPAQNSSVAATQALASILTAPGFDEIWQRHYKNRTSENPAHKIAAELTADGFNFESRPDLVSFSNELVGIEIGALGEEKKDEAAEITTLREQLGALRNYLSRFFPQKNLPEREKLPEASQEILEILEKETAQRPFTPMRSSYNFLKKWGRHIYDEMRERKISSAFLFLTSLGLFKFMRMRLPPAMKVRLTPEETAITNLSLDNIESSTAFTYDPSLIRTDLVPTCHDHLIQLTGSETFANFIRDTLTIGNKSLFPQDCTQMNTFAWDAQARLRGTYNFLNERLAWFTEDRVVEIGNALPQSHFVTAFNNAAHAVASNVYAFDAIENFTFHVGLLCASFVIAHKYNAMGSEETRKKWNSIKDFFNRTVRNNGLAYAFGAAAAGCYVAGGNPNADVGAFWSALGGGMVGNFVHKIRAISARRTHVKNLTDSAREKLAQFKEQAKEITSSMQNQQPLVVEHIQKGMGLKSKLALAFGTAAVAITGLACADAQGTLNAISNETVRNAFTKASEMAGALVGGGLVTGTYLAVNVPQDTFLHVIFAVVGGSLGSVTGKGAKLLARVTGKQPSKPVL